MLQADPAHTTTPSEDSAASPRRASVTDANGRSRDKAIAAPSDALFAPSIEEICLELDYLRDFLSDCDVFVGRDDNRPKETDSD